MITLLAPIALYPKVGEMAILVTVIFTFFYRGLLEISKAFLDPFGNHGSKSQNINTDVRLPKMELPQ